MSDVRITDLVDPGAIRQIKDLDAELNAVVETYTKVATEFAKGLTIEVKTAGDIEKLETLLIEKGKEAAEVQKQLADVVQRRGQALANTTNTAARALMEQERVNKSQREAYTEYERARKLLEEYNGSYDDHLKRMVELGNKLKAISKEQKDNEKAFKDGKMSLEDYRAAQLKLTEQQRFLSQEKRTLNQLLTAEEKSMQTADTSYNQMSQTLLLLKKAYRDLGEEAQKSPMGQEMEQIIQNLNAHLIDFDADLGEHQRNVGNYAIATDGLKKKYDELVASLASLQAQYAKLSDEEKYGDQGQQLSEGIREVSEAAKETKASIEEQNQALEEARRSLGETGGKTSSVKRDLKELVLEIANLTIEYQNLSEEEQASAEGQALADHIRDLTEQAGVLKDAIADTNQAITNAASDTRGFDQMGGAIQLAIDGFGLATGAAEMLGISSEDLAKIQTKLQAAIAASNAMQSIQNTLQAQSAVMQGVNLLQTKLRTVAENLHTAAQGKGVVATAALTAAQWAFNAAANANPIGLLVVAIVATIAAVYGLVKAFQAIIGPSDEALENYKQQKQALEEMCEANDKLIDRMKARGAMEAELLTQSLQNKQAEKEAADALFAKAQDLYDEDEDEYKESLEAKKRADKDYEASKEDGLNYLMKIQAEVHAYERENEIGTLAYKIEVIEAEKKKQLELADILYRNGEMTRQQYENIVAAVNKAAQIKIDKVKESETPKVSSRSSGGRGGVSTVNKSYNDLKKAVQAGEDALLKIIEDSLERQRQAELLSYQRRLKELQDALAKIGAAQTKMRDALNNQIRGLEAEHQRKMDDLEIAGMERRQKADSEFISLHLGTVKEGSEEELEWKRKALKNQRDMEYLSISKKERDKSLTQEQAEEMRATLVEKYAKQEEELEQDHAEKQLQIISQKYADQADATDTAMILELNALQSKYSEELAAAKGNAAKQAQLKEQFEKQTADIQEKYAVQTAKNAVSLIEEQLKTENLSAEEREKLERELAKAKALYEKQIADNTIANIERVNKADTEAKQKRMENASQWLQAAADSLNAINDLVGTVYDAKIQKVEEEQEANEEAAEAEQERITRLVETKVITEEEGEARKRAAEEKSAKKNEELEAKKAKLKEKQAKFDKLNSIAQSTIATALALMKLWVEPGFPAAIPMMAVVGALGALQLATIIATPLPKYAKGTDYHKGGPAIVGDGGVPELISYNGMSWITPDIPTIVDIPAGAFVAPDLSRIGLDTLAKVEPIAVPTGGIAPKAYNDSKILDRLDSLIYMEKQNEKRRRAEARDRQLSDIASKL